MEGIVLVNKPRDFTSFDVVAKLRGILKTRKIGHAGTLDPQATGVLPVFVGKATKAIPFLENHDKRYRAEFRLGLTSDTQDIWGEILRKREVSASPAQVAAVACSFEGPGEQLPPMYSAVKVEGKKLYELARKGIEVERKPRPVHFYAIRFLGSAGEANTYGLDVRCSGGSYIRTLCHDIGESLGCGAVMTALERTEACGYALADCHSLEEIQERMDREDGGFMLPLETAFQTFPRLEVAQRQGEMFCNGIRLDPRKLEDWREDLTSAPVLTVYCGSMFLGLAAYGEETGLLVSKRIFWERR